MNRPDLKMAGLLALALMLGILGGAWMDWQEARDRSENASSLSQRP